MRLQASKPTFPAPQISIAPFLISGVFALQQNCEIIDLGIAQENEAELARVLDEAIRGGADIILTSRGVSMGDRNSSGFVDESTGQQISSRLL